VVVGVLSLEVVVRKVTAWFVSFVLVDVGLAKAAILRVLGLGLCVEQSSHRSRR
jgi:hypothetical protein